MELTNQNVQELNKMQLLFINCGRWLERYNLKYNTDNYCEFLENYDYDKDRIVNNERTKALENLIRFINIFKYEEWFIQKGEEYTPCEYDNILETLGLSEVELKDKLLKCDYINDKFTELEIMINRNGIKEKLILGLF
ncbi:hypothetical protein DVV91_16790 [Clostridium botulinum]|uniref:hypothetical protein n=1 Tax=Clostridium botulinum TaxID=1491 RepID=UPI00196742B9|nr:hypothetical protein [Clostridium botulinum]MBN1075980.1 hypothetical protein [Clostridium botulinum]